MDKETIYEYLKTEHLLINPNQFNVCSDPDCLVYSILQKMDIFLSNSIKNIYKSMMIFVRLCVNGASLKSIIFEWKVSLNTIKHYLDAGAIYIDYFLQEYFCHDYWTLVCYIFKIHIYMKYIYIYNIK